MKAIRNRFRKIKTVKKEETFTNLKFTSELPQYHVDTLTPDNFFPRSVYDHSDLTYIKNKDLIDSDTNVYYYNSSICKYKDGYRLFYRCGKNPKTAEDRIATCLLSKNLEVIPGTNKYIDAFSNWEESRSHGPDIIERHIRYTYKDENEDGELKSFIYKPNTHVEDPRAIEYNGYWFIFYTDGLTIGVAKLDLESCDVIYSHFLNPPPANYKNSKSDGREKNWIPFVSDEKLYILYSDTPRTYIQYTDTLTELIPINYDQLNYSVVWNYGDIRGGCPPVEYKNQFIWFFHSCMNLGSYIGNNRRVYIIGAYISENKYPFKVTKISTHPLLIGIPSKVSKETLQDNVVFPCGAILDNDEFIISMGINDYKIAHLRVKLDDIQFKKHEPLINFIKFV